MLDRNQLKNNGVRYARSLQLLFRTASMFAGTHSALAIPLQNSFDQLNALVKTYRQFTIGFVDNRVLLNNILTTDKSLQALETEFLKRGIGAVTFDAGITMSAYKRAILILSMQAKEIETQGGISNYLATNALESVRVFPASKNQHRNDSGDTVLDMDSESFLLAKAMNEIRNPNIDRIDMLMKQTGIESDGVGVSGGEGSGDGIGLGGGDGSGSGPGGGGSGAPGIGGPGSGGPGGGPIGSGSVAGPAGITSMVENYFNSCVMDSDDAPQRSYLELARIIQDSRPEFVLQNFSPQRREELRKLPPDQMAAEVIEDTAVKWAMERLSSVPTGSEATIVEEEVIRVLLRSLQQSQMAGRLAQSSRST
jgi:hypothetical protein